MEFNTILVLCTGNICRSPMAAGFLKQYFPDKQIISAGLQDLSGDPADAIAVELMQEADIDISAHRAQHVNQGLLRQADLIFVMTKSQLRILEKQWPFVRGKTYLIGHWQKQEIPDPYQQPKSAFIYAKQQLLEAIQSWHEKLSS